MADFKTHITTSTVLGIAYGAGGYYFGLPWEDCTLAAGLCSVSGMLPDLDSDSGVPVRESFSFAAAFVPMLLVDRLEQIGLQRSLIVAIGGLIYVFIRFGVSEIFKRYTVHRGMWHSIPAAATAGLIAYLLITDENMVHRLFMTAAVVFGFMIHLTLDEIWAIEMKWTGIRFKRSFGTAMKLWSSNGWANISTYAKLGLLVFYTIQYDPAVMKYYQDHNPNYHKTARDNTEVKSGGVDSMLR